MPLKWNGQTVTAQLQRRLAAGVGEIGLQIETEAKRELQPGHGVLTGTLRRSIHAAGPEHNFAGDGTGEQGGQAPQAERQGDRIMVAVGSGLVYAMAVHQGHHSFEGYHYLTNAVEKVKPRALAILRKHAAGGAG